MVKNFQGLNRMRSTPSMNHRYNSDDHNNDSNNMNSQSPSWSFDSTQSRLIEEREARDALREVLASPNLAEQASRLYQLSEKIGRGSNVPEYRDYPPVPPIPSVFAAASKAPIDEAANSKRDFLTQQMAQLELTLRTEHEKLDKILADAKCTLSTASGSASCASTVPVSPQATADNAKIYTKPFTDFLTNNPTVFHAVATLAAQLKHAGFTPLSERIAWDIKKGGKYYVTRNDSSLIAFVVGEKYAPGNGAAILAGHVDALTAKLKPISQVPNKSGFVQLGVAPYAGGLGPTWWDRDLSIGGRVIVKESSGKISSKLVKLDWPIAKIPTLAPHFGAPANGPFNQETQMTPIIGLESADPDVAAAGPVGSFTATQPPRLVHAIANELGIEEADYKTILNWELELFDLQPATVLGLNKEFITAGRIDDKLCSWAALQALLNSASYHTPHSGLIKIVGLFDDEEIGSGLRQGARSNLLPTVIERAVGSLANHTPRSDLIGQTYANSFIVSSDVTHSVNPNFESVYLANHAPGLNIGVSVSADSNGHMTTDAPSTTIFAQCAERVGAKLQVFQIRNDSRSGGTVGPMLSCATGIRSIDAGIPQLSMHSIRATTGALDPGLGVITFEAFLNGFEDVDRAVRGGEDV